MAGLTTRNRDDGLKRNLRIRATEYGRPMEEKRGLFSRRYWVALTKPLVRRYTNCSSPLAQPIR